MAAEEFRNLRHPIDVGELDAMVATFYGIESEEEKQWSIAKRKLLDLQNDPDMWFQVKHILQITKELDTKFFALQVLQNIIQFRWMTFPVQQRDEMRHYVYSVIEEVSSDETSFREQRLYVNKLNIILVQILKHDWPARWQSFIPDLVSAAKTSHTTCENCMAILKLLGEEIFDFSRWQITKNRRKELRRAFNSELKLIHELVLYGFHRKEKEDVKRATLSLLHVLILHIALEPSFQSKMLKILLKIFPMTSYRNLTLQCLTEVFCRSNSLDVQYLSSYDEFMVQLQNVLPLKTNIPEVYEKKGKKQAFIQNLALFFTSFYKGHINVLETRGDKKPTSLKGLKYLIKISYVDDIEVFKICLEFWNSFVLELSGSQQRQQLYAKLMSKLRMLMICRMAKPEEVLIAEEKNGNIDCQTMKDNDVLVQYETMRETLIHLSRFDHEDTKKKMVKMLNRHLSGEERNWNKLSTLCWAIGSISESMTEELQTRFLSIVFPKLEELAQMTKEQGIGDAVFNSFLYVLGQYPRFLPIKRTMNLLIKLMHERHPGIKDMASKTFLKIVQKCKREFVIIQVGESESFASKLLIDLPTTIENLGPHQIRTFYESVGHMIQAESDPHKRDKYLRRLMKLPNKEWVKLVGQARGTVDILKDESVIRSVLDILQINTSVATSLGRYFSSHICLIFLDMLNVYRMCSELISSNTAEGAPFASKTSYVELLRLVKRETLKLIETFLDKAEDQPQLGKQFVPPMMDLVLGDYVRNPANARESEVLSLFATVINKYKGAMIDDMPCIFEVPRIFEDFLQRTLEMITENIEDYPNHQLKFFSLLHAIANHCFPVLIRLPSQQLKLVMDSIIRAFRSKQSNIAETGLKLLLEMLKNFQNSGSCNDFYGTYFLSIEQEIFAVLTDTLHKSGFKLHALVLQHLFCLLETGLLTKPLWDVATESSAHPSRTFVCDYTIKLLCTLFPNVTEPEVIQFVNGLFESRDNLNSFKKHIEDFLVRSKEFSAQENSDSDLQPSPPSSPQEPPQPQQQPPQQPQQLQQRRNLICSKTVTASEMDKNFEVPVDLANQIEEPIGHAWLTIYLHDVRGVMPIRVSRRRNDGRMFFLMRTWRLYRESRLLHPGSILGFYRRDEPNNFWVEQ